MEMFLAYYHFGFHLFLECVSSFRMYAKRLEIESGLPV